MDTNVSITVTIFERSNYDITTHFISDCCTIDNNAIQQLSFENDE